MSKNHQPHGGIAAATKPAEPPATMQAATKPLSAEDQAKLDQEINGNLGKPKKDKEKKPSAPRGGSAPGGKTWVAWFQEKVGVKKEGESDEDYTKRAKAAEAEYVELRKGEPAYSGEDGAGKLKRHAYHHRVLALDPDKAKKPAASAA